ncbi:MAG TPA: DCC1-like thiol-disulfide oxidoreductase family protein [Candidatus Binatia bacterium]|nr:DCC1-like thiol-disulfide oxidoreductase family protein [Candidatus Binatia bacterium]
MAVSAAPVVLLYDPNCPFCRRCARFLREHDRDRRLEVRRNDSPGLAESVGLSREEVDSAAWAVEPGRRHRGAAAINRAVAELRGGWPLVARAYALPFLRPLEDAAYDWVANHRSIVSRLWSDPPEAAHRP